jgi:hypothetical protein
MDIQPPSGFTLVNGGSGEGEAIKPPPGFTLKGKPQSTWGAVTTALNERPELQPYGGIQDFKTSPDPLEAVTQTLSAPLRVGSTISQPGFRKAGGAVAESLGAEGVNPNISAAIGTILATVPDVAQAGLAIKNLMTSPSMIQKAIRSKPAELSKEYDFQNEKAGISGDLPVRAGRLPGYEKTSADLGDLETVKNVTLNPPVSYPKEPAAFLNFAKARMKAFGNELTTQELTDYRSVLKGFIEQGSKRLNAAAGDGAHAIASKLNKQATELQSTQITDVLKNVQVPKGFEKTREGLNELYSLSLRLHPELGKIVVGAAKKIWPHFRWGTILVP